jgi:hypothetical protein
LQRGGLGINRPFDKEGSFMHDRIVKRKGDLLEAEVDSELVGLNVASGTCYGFNATATRVWALLEEPKSVASIRDALMAEFDVDRATCERQLIDLLEELERDGLVEVTAGPDP